MSEPNIAEDLPEDSLNPYAAPTVTIRSSGSQQLSLGAIVEEWPVEVKGQLKVEDILRVHDLPAALPNSVRESFDPMLWRCIAIVICAALVVGLYRLSAVEFAMASGALIVAHLVFTRFVQQTTPVLAEARHWSIAPTAIRAIHSTHRGEIPWGAFLFSATSSDGTILLLPATDDAWIVWPRTHFPNQAAYERVQRLVNEHYALRKPTINAPSATSIDSTQPIEIETSVWPGAMTALDALGDEYGQPASRSRALRIWGRIWVEFAAVTSGLVALILAGLSGDWRCLLSVPLVIVLGLVMVWSQDFIRKQRYCWDLGPLTIRLDQEGVLLRTAHETTWVPWTSWMLTVENTSALILFSYLNLRLPISRQSVPDAADWDRLKAFVSLYLPPDQTDLGTPPPQLTREESLKVLSGQLDRCRAETLAPVPGWSARVSISLSPTELRRSLQVRSQVMPDIGWVTWLELGLWTLLFGLALWVGPESTPFLGVLLFGGITLSIGLCGKVSQAWIASQANFASQPLLLVELDETSVTVARMHDGWLPVAHSRPWSYVKRWAASDRDLMFMTYDGLEVLLPRSCLADDDWTKLQDILESHAPGGRGPGHPSGE